MQLSDILRYRSCLSIPKVGFTSMHANQSDFYQYYFLEIRVVTYRFITYLLENDYWPEKSPKMIENYKNLIKE